MTTPLRPVTSRFANRACCISLLALLQLLLVDALDRSPLPQHVADTHQDRTQVPGIEAEARLRTGDLSGAWLDSGRGSDLGGEGDIEPNDRAVFVAGGVDYIVDATLACRLIHAGCGETGE